MEAPQQNANRALQPLGGSDKALGWIRIFFFSPHLWYYLKLKTERVEVKNRGMRHWSESLREADMRVSSLFLWETEDGYWETWRTPKGWVRRWWSKFKLGRLNGENLPKSGEQNRRKNKTKKRKFILYFFSHVANAVAIFQQIKFIKFLISTAPMMQHPSIPITPCLLIWFVFNASVWTQN